MANSNSARLFMAVLLTFSTTVNASYRALNPLEQLQKRNPYYGGFALPEPSLGCPVGLETCEGSFCCPMGTFCGPTSNGAYCCPTDADCYNQVNDLPTCADPSWTLFNDVYMWCCTGTDIGISGQACAAPDVTYSADDYAATETQANTATPPATRSGETSAATTTTGSGMGSAPTTTSGKTTTATPTSSTSAASSSSTAKSSGSSMTTVGGLLVLSVLALFANSLSSGIS